MKILYVTTSRPGFDGNGGSSFTAVFLEELRRRGIEVTVLRIRSINPRRRLIDRQILDQGIVCHTISAFIPPIFGHPVLVPRLLRFLARKLRLEYDVVHAANGWVAVASEILAKDASVNFIVQFIGDDVNSDLQSLKRDSAYVQALKSAKRHLFNSQKLAAEFALHFPDMAVPREVARRGVRLSEFSFELTPSQGMTVMFLGGAARGNAKGFFTVMSAIGILQRNGPDLDIHFIIAGPNTKKYERKYPSRRNNLRVSFVGELSRKDVIQYLARSHIVMIPSLAEGIPNVLYEAMASGNLVIATNVGGIPEVIRDGVDGLLINPNSPSELAGALSAAVHDRGHVDMLARAARTRVEAMNYDNHISIYVRIYAEIA